MNHLLSGRLSSQTFNLHILVLFRWFLGLSPEQRTAREIFRQNRSQLRRTRAEQVANDRAVLATDRQQQQLPVRTIAAKHVADGDCDASIGRLSRHHAGFGADTSATAANPIVAGEGSDEASFAVARPTSSLADHSYRAASSPHSASRSRQPAQQGPQPGVGLGALWRAVTPWRRGRPLGSGGDPSGGGDDDDQRGEADEADGGDDEEGSGSESLATPRRQPSGQGGQGGQSVQRGWLFGALNDEQA